MSRSKNENHPFGFSRRDFLKLTAVSSLALATPLAWPRGAWAVDGDILKIRSSGDTRLLDPALSENLNEFAINEAIYNRLIAYKPNTNKWEWELQAAESIEQVDPTHIKFTLRPGIIHSNGFGEMSAEDVKFSFERIKDPKTKSPNVDDWSVLDHVEVTGPYSGVIVLTAPSAPLWVTTLPFCSGNIVSKKAVESVGGSFSGEPPSCSGPYLFKEWKPKQATILVRNPDWKGPKPDFAEIHIIPVDDENTATIAFEAGDLDFTEIDAATYKTYQDQPPKNGKVVKAPALTWVWLGINKDNDVMKNPDVRRAIQLSVNLPDIMDAAYFGQAQPCGGGQIPPGVIGHRAKSMFPATGDMAQAKALLAKAGYPDGLEVNLDVLNKTTFVTIAQVMQASMAEAGIKVNINLYESGTFWSLGSEADGDYWKKLQMYIMRYASVPEPSYYTRWHTKDQVGIWNWERFDDPEYNDLHVKALTEADPAERDRMYQRMQEIMEASGCFRFLTNEVSTLVYNNRVVPAMTPDGSPIYREFKLKT